MTERRYWQMQWVFVLLLACTFASPHIFHARETGYEGLVRMISTDDGFYFAHVKAALLHRTSEVTNGITGGPAQGASPTLLEYIFGTLFSWTLIKAPQLIALLTVFLTPLIFFALVALLRLIGIGRLATLLWSLAYVILFLDPLQKPVQLSLTLPLSVALLLLLHLLWQRPRVWIAVLTGFLFGLMPWVYFWSWTYLWSIAGTLLLLTAFLIRPSKEKVRRIRMMSLAGLVTCIISAKYFIDQYVTAHRIPDIFSETAIRSTLIHSHWVESPLRFVVLTWLLIAVIFLVRTQRKDSHAWIFPLAAVLGMYIAMYQNIIHGILLSFSSHYYPFVCLSALIAGVYTLHLRGHLIVRIAVLLPVLILFTAAAHDYRDRLSIFTGQYHIRTIDQLAPAVHLLDDNHRETVLTDRVSAHAITSWTDDDVLFTAYAKHLLISDTEYGERYCLSEILNPKGPDIAWLAQETIEWPDPALTTKREAQFKAVCRTVRANPYKFLKKYSVTKVLWNERLRPEWRPAPWMTRLSKGDGWSVWTIRV